VSYIMLNSVNYVRNSPLLPQAILKVGIMIIGFLKTLLHGLCV